MAYDIHIIKTRDWFEAREDPICKPEVDDLIASDPELEWSTEDWIDMDDGNGSTARYFMILWKGEPVFLWYLDQITCSGPMDDQIVKAVDIAKTLNGRVVGDEGEVYNVQIASDGTTSVKTNYPD